MSFTVVDQSKYQRNVRCFDSWGNKRC